MNARSRVGHGARMLLGSVALLVGLASVVGITAGMRELQLARSCAAGPVPVELEDLEQGKYPSQAYVTIDPHVALHAYGYAGETADDGSSEWVVYPIVSASHPFLDQVRKAAGRRDVSGPKLAGVSIVCLDQKRQALSKTPVEMGATGGDGLLTNLFLSNHISKQQHDAIVAMVESARQGRVIVFEKGLRPKPVWLCIVWISAGSIGLATILFLWVRRRRAIHARVNAPGQRETAGGTHIATSRWSTWSRRDVLQFGVIVVATLVSASLPAMWVGGFLGDTAHPDADRLLLSVVAFLGGSLGGAYAAPQRLSWRHMTAAGVCNVAVLWGSLAYLSGRSHVYRLEVTLLTAPILGLHYFWYRRLWKRPQ